MGLVLALQRSFSNSKKTAITESSHHPSKFVDLHRLPAELALNVLSRLNATDLYLASCVWYDLAYDELLWRRPQVLRGLINLKDFRNHSLPNALRGLFSELPAPISGPSASTFIHSLVSMFSERFAQCNPDLGITRDEIYLLCFSMIMLSVDLWSPSIKNKMSKREFIRNTRQVVTTASNEFLGNLYDNVYIVGHVVLIDCCGSPFRHLEAKAILSKNRTIPLSAF
ncbi:F-box only protein 8 [Schistosoma japonicum]|nr:F-box only protein 8 [Schistosoma japonicum]